MEIEKRKENLNWLSEGETSYKVFVHHEKLEREIYDRDNAMRLFEECLVDIYQQLENLKKGTNQQEPVSSVLSSDVISSVKDKLTSKIKKLEARICVLEAHQKDDNSTLIN